ncbi:MAG: PQQ-binding-like beta-propeller repeat protein [Opitutaceae bacterium]
MKNLPLLIICTCLHVTAAFGQNWPQASGLNGDWSAQVEGNVPSQFNVAKRENVLWKKTLIEGGQSGIAVWEDRLFLTIMKPFGIGDQKKPVGSTIHALCLDANNGDTIWDYVIEGSAESNYMYGFSDSTSPTPITDGAHVWFTNASGKMVCLTWAGEFVWERSWRSVNEVLKPKKGFPFNKQFEPFMVGDTIVNMEPYDNTDGARVLGWHYLHALDRLTGELKWVSEDSMTHYNTPVYSKNALGKPTVMIGRGAPHGVPEKPIGYSMIDLEDGSRIWQSEFPGIKGSALYNAAFTQKYAVWFSYTDNALVVLDPQNGAQVKKIDLNSKVDLRTFDQSRGQYVLQKDFALSETENPNVFPAWYTNVIVGEHVYFMCFKDEFIAPMFKRKMQLGPRYAFARVNLETELVEYLEVPVHIDDNGTYMWQEELKTTAENSRGLSPTPDKRSQRDGWYWCFNGNPIQVNDTLYFTTMIGNCYTFDTSAEAFDKSAFIALNPLGVRGESWSLNTPSFANGKLYHRTMKELICIAPSND